MWKGKVEEKGSTNTKYNRSQDAYSVSPRPRLYTQHNHTTRRITQCTQFAMTCRHCLTRAHPQSKQVVRTVWTVGYTLTHAKGFLSRRVCFRTWNGETIARTRVSIRSAGLTKIFWKMDRQFVWLSTGYSKSLFVWTLYRLFIIAVGVCGSHKNLLENGR